MDSAPNTPVVFLLGATATGKTAIAFELVKRFPVEIISVDSALIYRGMNIGTAKPGEKERRVAPHHLVDIIDPWEHYSVAEFIRDTQSLLKKIRENQKIPLLVGGTMMYFNALENGLTEMPAADEKLRKVLENKAKLHGWDEMHRELATVDPQSATRIHPNDPQRILRALEVWHASGRSLSDWHSQADSTPSLNALKFGLFPQSRESLHQRIETRFRTMLEAGFIEEVEALRALPQMHKDLASMRCVGYRQVWDYLEGAISREQMVDKGIAATRQLAKRQITWMRKMQNITLIDSEEVSIEQIVQRISPALESISIH